MAIITQKYFNLIPSALNNAPNPLLQQEGASERMKLHYLQNIKTIEKFIYICYPLK